MRRGPGHAELAKAFLFEQRRRAVARLRHVSGDDFEELFDQMLDLPARDVSMQLQLPRILTPELEDLRVAIDDEKNEEVDELIGPALAQLDGPERRAELARAVLAQADAGRMPALVAAVAIVDLTCDSSALLQSSLVQSLAVSVGAARTPGGLLVVAR